jgi:hypothetical protein
MHDVRLWSEGASRRGRAVAALAMALIASGCASTRGAEEDGAALILATDAYELHYRAGKVLVVRAAEAIPAQVEEIKSYREFRGLYNVGATANWLPEVAPSPSVEVTGRRGLACVRATKLCGPATDFPSRGDAVRLRLEFPQRQ